MASLLEAIRAQQGPVYGVFDAARSRDVYPELVRSQLFFRSLYDNPAAARFIDIAPYLTQLDPQSEALPTLLERAEGDSWAIFLGSSAPFDEIRHHLRKFIKVELEGKEHAVFFRFYDPRVFREVIPGFDAEQLQRFFELPDYYLCESASERGVERYTFGGEALEVLPAIPRES